MKWIVTVLMMSSFCAFAEVEPSQVESMLSQMVRENVISAEEAARAKFRLKNIKPEEWKAINAQANKVAARSPASVKSSNNKIEEVHNIDLDGEQFKAIQNEMRKIVPQYQD